MAPPLSTSPSEEDLSQYSASNIDQLLERKRKDVRELQSQVVGQPEPEPEPEAHCPAPPAEQQSPKTRAYHVRVSLTNVRRFPTLARYSQLGDVMPRSRPASARYGQPPNVTPNMRDLHNTRMLPPTDYETIPPKVVSENAEFEQRMRTTQPVIEKPRFYPCNASAARRELANSGSASCLPPSLQPGPAWAFSGSPQWQPSVRQTIGGQDVPAQNKPPFRPCSATAARDQIKGGVTLFSADEKERRQETRRQREMARYCASKYATSYPTASRPQPRLSWAKAW